MRRVVGIGAHPGDGIRLDQVNRPVVPGRADGQNPTANGVGVAVGGVPVAVGVLVNVGVTVGVGVGVGVACVAVGVLVLVGVLVGPASVYRSAWLCWLPSMSAWAYW